MSPKTKAIRKGNKALVLESHNRRHRLAKEKTTVLLNFAEYGEKHSNIIHIKHHPNQNVNNK